MLVVATSTPCNIIRPAPIYVGMSSHRLAIHRAEHWSAIVAGAEFPPIDFKNSPVKVVSSMGNLHIYRGSLQDLIFYF